MIDVGDTAAISTAEGVGCDAEAACLRPAECALAVRARSSAVAAVVFYLHTTWAPGNCVATYVRTYA